MNVNYDKNYAYREQLDNNYEDYTDFGLDIKVRHRFILKVFSLLSVCLVITIGIMCTFRFVETARTFISERPFLLYIAFALIIVLSLVFACIPSARRKYPLNIILLFIFASIYGLVLGFATIAYKADGILYAAGITLALVLFLIFFACQTRFDFTGWGPYLFVFLFGLMILGIFAMIFRSEALILVYSYIGAILFSFYMIYDVQIIMGGKKEQIHESEYVLATLNLYLDIINLFLFILNIVGGSRD